MLYWIWRRLRVALLAMALFALLGLVGWHFAARWQPSAASFPVQGVDVSEDNGPLNWWTLKGAGVQFAYARATSGAGRRDAQFADNWRNLEAAAIARGVIHVFSLCESATDQARNFVTTVPRSDDMLPVALELGFTPDCKTRPERAKVLDEIRRLLVAIETHTGKHALLKVSRGFESKYSVSEAVPRKLWAQQFFLQPGYLARPWTMWEANGFHRLDGVDMPVHWDVIAKEAP